MKTNMKLQFVIASLFFALPVLAQTPTSTPTLTPPSAAPRTLRQEHRTNTQEMKQDFRQNIQEKRRDLRQGVQTQRTDLRQFQGTKEELQQKREDLKKTMLDKMEAFRNEVNTKREELKKKIETQREELKKKLQKIKDERKRAAVERIEKAIAELNERRIDHFNKAADQIEKVLERITSRVDKAETNSRDVSKVRTAITAAEDSIAKARDAIKAQAGKTYTVTINTEEKLRADVGSARKALHDDLMKVQEAVKAAREAVYQAARTLAEIRGVDELEVPPATAPAPAPVPAPEPTPTP